MEIQSLRFVVGETDLNDLASGFLQQRDNIRDLHISVLPEGVRVCGTYQTMIGVPFETLWQLSVSEGKIVATLEKLKSGVLSLGVAKSYLLRTVAGAVDMLELSGDKILLNVDLLLRNRGIPLRTNLTAIRCDYGSLTVESGEAR